MNWDELVLQDVPAMLKGEDAAVLHVLRALGLSFKLVRVWKDEVRPNSGSVPVAGATTVATGGAPQRLAVWYTIYQVAVPWPASVDPQSTQASCAC